MVAKRQDYNTTGITKGAFKKDVLQKVQGQHFAELRGGQKFIDRNKFRHTAAELAEFLKAHPKLTANRASLKKMGVDAYEGSALKEDFDNQEFLKRVDRYAVGEQKEQDASKNTGPTKEELKRQERRRLVNIATGRSLRMRAEDAGKGPARFANPKVGAAGFAGGHDEKAGSSATVRGKDVQTSVSGDPTKNVAGLSAAQRSAGASGAAIPGQHASSPVTPPQSRGSVQLAGGIGISRIEGRPADRADDVAIPRIGIPNENGGTEKTVPTPGLRTEDTDVHPDKNDDDELPSTKDIDQNLPLAA